MLSLAKTQNAFEMDSMQVSPKNLSHYKGVVGKVGNNLGTNIAEYRALEPVRASSEASTGLRRRTGCPCTLRVPQFGVSGVFAACRVT